MKCICALTQLFSRESFVTSVIPLDYTDTAKSIHWPACHWIDVRG